MDEKTILEWKEANAELYSKFKHDLEEQLGFIYFWVCCCCLYCRGMFIYLHSNY